LPLSWISGPAEDKINQIKAAMYGRTNLDLLQAFQCLLPANAAHFKVIRPAPAVLDAVVRGRDRHDQHHSRRGLHDFGECLRERELRLKAPGGEIVTAVEQPCVGHPLVDEDDAWGVHL
jgi:hypothetical protein